MTKKSTSSSNVPAQAKPAVNNKPKSSPQKNNGNLHSNNGNGTVLNSKHLHNQLHQQKSKKPRDNENNCGGLQGGSTSDLMKKLSEAVQKQQKDRDNTSSNHANVKRTRKGTAPAGIMQNNSAYAGAAFDRAPAVTSFPIPSFIKTTNNSASLSQSCPLPSSLESPSLKTVSISELFPADNSATNSEKKKLDTLTNDLRKLLNLK